MTNARSELEPSDSSRAGRPPANTGSALLNAAERSVDACWCTLERRFDPFVRPAFDAVLRDPIARLTTALINRKRRNEGLKIAEERPIPGRRGLARLRSSTASTKQMRLLWKPGGFERGGNTKTHGIVRGEFIVHDGLPAELRHGIYAQPRDLPCLGALFRSRTLRHAGYRRCRVHEHQHQADGRARSEADGRGEVHPGHVRRVDADLRDAGYQGERAAADREPEERPDLLLRQPPSSAHARFHHAGAVDQDAEQSVRSAVLQLRAVSARRRAGDAVLGVAEIDEADADPAAAAAPAGRLSARCDGDVALRKATSSSTSGCSGRPIRT